MYNISIKKKLMIKIKSENRITICHLLAIDNQTISAYGKWKQFRQSHSWQAVEHLIKLLEVQAENQNKEIPIEKDEMNIEEVSALIKKSISTVYRYTCQQCIPYTKIGNTLHFYRSEILEWMKLHKKKSIQDLYNEASIESFKVLNRD